MHMELYLKKYNSLLFTYKWLIALIFNILPKCVTFNSDRLCTWYNRYFHLKWLFSDRWRMIWEDSCVMLDQPMEPCCEDSQQWSSSVKFYFQNCLSLFKGKSSDVDQNCYLERDYIAGKFHSGGASQETSLLFNYTH